MIILPRPVKHIMSEFTIFLSRKAGIHVCTLKLIENKPPVNHNRPRLMARHSEPKIGVPRSTILRISIFAIFTRESYVVYTTMKQNNNK